MNLTAKTKVCMIIGDPVDHSLSPKMHNAGYAARDLDFAYIASLVKKAELKKALDGIRALGITGVSVTIPHKQDVIQYLDEIDETAQKIGAVNTIINENGILKGSNTDWIGIVKPLEKISNLKKDKAVVIGAGGAASAAVYGLLKLGVNRVGIYNRTPEKAKSLASEFGVEHVIEYVENIKDADIIINATSLGLHKDDPLPVSTNLIHADQFIFDLVYSQKKKTKFIEESEKMGAKALTGIDMLLEQGYAQFKLFTGVDAPTEAMRNALINQLQK